MPGGLIQLVAKGVEDLFLTDNPQITFFKIIYRRHTNFSIEEIPQTFVHTPDFGKKTTCVISKSGDLISNMVLVITLPQLPQIFNIDGSIDNLTRVAWIRKIGYGIIKEITIEIGGKLIDVQYGEWLNIWHELNESKEIGNDKMIGNIEELYNYSLNKPEYKLFIPLHFWFSQSISLSLPIICLQYNEIKINLELQDFNKCYKISPTHSILMSNDICNFIKDEYIVQKIDNYEAVGQFSYYDNETNKLYYTRISKNLFKTCNLTNITNIDLQEEEIKKYEIKGLTSEYFADPFIIYPDDSEITYEQTYSVSYAFNQLTNIKIKECFLLINYIFLDEDERIKYYKNAHEYLIEQLVYCGETTLDGVYRTAKVGLYNPVKYMIWTVQQNYLSELYNNDPFNYTNSYKYNDILYSKLLYDSSFIEDDIVYNYKNNGTFNEKYNHKQNGKGLIKKSIILFNSNARMEEQTSIYYKNVQTYQHFKYLPQEGINVYSFALNPDNIQPSGSCNMSKIDNIQIQMTLDDIVTVDNPVKFKCYAIVHNMLMINAGLGGLMFVN